MRTAQEGEEPRRSVPPQLPIAPDDSPAVPPLQLAGTNEKLAFGSATLLRAPLDQRKTGNMERAMLSHSLRLRFAELTLGDSTSERSSSPYKCLLGPLMAIPPA